MFKASYGRSDMDKRYLAVGVALGVAVGVATDNLAIGIALGTVAGLLVGKWRSGRDNGI
jgi:hypothetical protein